MTFSPAGRQIASSSFDKTVKIWDAATGELIRTLRGHRGLIFQVAYSPDGTRIASAGVDINRPSQPGELRLWVSGRDNVGVWSVGYASVDFDQLIARLKIPPPPNAFQRRELHREVWADAP